MKWIKSQSVFCLALGLAVLMVPREAAAQLAPTGGHYAGRASDTGHEPGMVNASGGYTISVPLNLPAARGGMPVPVQIVSGGRGVGAVGLGWDVPLSYVRLDTTFAHRRPASGADSQPVARELLTLSLQGRGIDFVPKGTDWVARNDAPELLLRARNGGWVLFDGQARTYFFTSHASLNGTGLWLLTKVTGPGGTSVQLDYDIRTAALPGGNGVSIDLVHVLYNTHPQTTCAKHEVTLNYGPANSAALSLSMIEDKVLARMRTLYTLDVMSRATCAAPAERLRRYEFSYLPDADTQQPRLRSVQMFGRQGTPEQNTGLPVAAYTYGSASSTGHLINQRSRILRYKKTQSIPLPSAADTRKISSTERERFGDLPVPVGVGYNTWQSLTDVTGDGRPDFVFERNGKLSVARNRPGPNGRTTFTSQASAQLSDTTFSKGAFETRSATNNRFTYGANHSNADWVWRQAIDVNGDGRVDIIDAAEEAGRWIIYLNTPGAGASGVKWERRSFQILKLLKHLNDRGLGFGVPSKFLPLVSRFTSRDRIVNDTGALVLTGPELTYTEWEVKDINGDGYPDLVFNSSPIGSVPAPTPTPGGTAISRVQPRDGDGNKVMAVLNLRGLFHDEQNPFSSPVVIRTATAESNFGNTLCGVGLWAGERDTQRLVCGLADINGDGLLDRIENTRDVFLGTGSLGTGSGFSKVHLTLPGPFAIQQSDQVATCVDQDPNTPPPAPPGDTEYGAAHLAVMRDVTGDGIPDYMTNGQVAVGTGTGFAAPIDVEVLGVGMGLSGQRERCDGRESHTLSGLYDINGDGKPELVKLNGPRLDVFQLSGGTGPGTPEAGRLIQVDNGYGAKTTIRYGSAKEDGSTKHQVPFPEVVVTSIETRGTLGLGGNLSATRYAYGGAELMYDSAMDAFRLPGYRRAVALRVIARRGHKVEAQATVTDTYPLAPFAATPKNERFGRYLKAGRVKDVTVLSGNLGDDPRALLGVDITSDARLNGSTHYDWDTRLFEENRISGTNLFDCMEKVNPLDFVASFQANQGPNNFLDVCSAHGFVFGRAVESWRGTAAPPSTANVQTRSEVRGIDDFGRVTSVFHQKDRFRIDDDVCVNTLYAEPNGQNERMLSAPSSQKVTNCFILPGLALTFAATSWIYDNLPPGRVAKGFVTSQTVDRRATDDGEHLNNVHVFDADYDTAGNLTKITTKRGDATRKVLIDYDTFGLATVRTKSEATDVPSMVVNVALDPITLDVLNTTDVNKTQRGAEFDGFGRLVRSTVTPPGEQVGVLSTLTYLGFSGNDPLGCRIVGKGFTDPVAPTEAAGTSGRIATIYLDELGRERRTELALGADYANEKLIASARNYDNLGRVLFEADPFPASQDAGTAYGTTYFYNTDGTPSCFIRGRGLQMLNAVTDEPTERYPTCFTQSFFNHQETVGVRDAASLLANSPQAGVVKQVTSTAIGRVLSRSTLKTGVRLEHATFAHDRLGHLTGMTRFLNPASASSPVDSSWRFDSLGQILEWRDPESATQFNTYSDWGESVEVKWTDTTVLPNVDRRQLNTYDALGRVTHSEERNNRVTDPETVNDYAYDEGVSVTPQVTPTHLRGRLAQAKAPTGDDFFSYDAFGRVNARTFTDKQGGTYVEKTTLHADGTPLALEFFLPDNGFKQERVDYSYDSANRLRSMKFLEGTNSQELYQASDIDAFGRVRKASYGGTTRYAASYADLGRRMMQEVSVSSPLGARGIVYFGFDPIGRERGRREIRDGGAGGPKTNITYDAIGRLSSQVQSDGPTQLSNRQFTYDALGNTLRLTDVLGDGDAVLSYNTNDRDRICRIGYGDGGLGGDACNVAHDAVGNIIEQPTRSGVRKLNFLNSGSVRSITEGTTRANFRYDAFGGVQELNLQGAGTLDTRHDRRYGGLIERRDQVVAGSTTTFISRQIPGPGGIVASRRGPGNDWVFHFGESRGNRLFTDRNGAFLQDVEYQPYGESKSSGAQPGSSQYTTSQWNGGDALSAFGLSHLGARLYDPVMGRFLSRDPLLMPRTAATTNAYAFAMNDPINGADPSGLQCIGRECEGPPGEIPTFPGEGPIDLDLSHFLPSPAAPASGGANPQASYRPPVPTVFWSAPSGPQTALGRAAKATVERHSGVTMGSNYDYDYLGASMSDEDIEAMIDQTPEGIANVEAYNATIDTFSSSSSGFGDAIWFWCPGCAFEARRTLGIKSGDADRKAYFVGSIIGIAAGIATPGPTSVIRSGTSSGIPGGAVNLASPQRTRHILLGDSTGGGHMWPGLTGKTAFPKGWSGEKIMHYVSDIASDPTLQWGGGGPGRALFTRAGKAARFFVIGEREGIRIKVIVEPMGEGIISGYPYP